MCLPAENMELARFGGDDQGPPMAPGPLLAMVAAAVAGGDGAGLAQVPEDMLFAMISGGRRMSSWATWLEFSAMRELALRHPPVPRRPRTARPAAPPPPLRDTAGPRGRGRLRRRAIRGRGPSRSPGPGCRAAPCCRAGAGCRGRPPPARPVAARPGTEPQPVNEPQPTPLSLPLPLPLPLLLPMTGGCGSMISWRMRCLLSCGCRGTGRRTGLLMRVIWPGGCR